MLGIGENGPMFIPPLAVLAVQFKKNIYSLQPGNSHKVYGQKAYI